MIKFHGTNFGYVDKLSQAQVLIGNHQCLVNRDNYRNDQFECLLGPKVNGEVATVSESSDVHVSIKENGFGVRERRFFIEGVVKAPGKFTFRNPSFKSIHPYYGPALGGTTVLLHGENLNIGSNVQAFVGDRECKIVSSTKFKNEGVI